MAHRVSQFAPRVRSALLLLALFSPLVVAQAPPATPTKPAEQPAGVQRMLRGVPLTYLHGLGRELADELNLNDEHMLFVATMVDDYQGRITEDRRRVRAIRMGLRELADARAAGDTAKAAEVEERIRSVEAERAVGGGGDTTDLQAEFFDQVRGGLPAELAPKIRGFEQRWNDRRQLGERLRVAIDGLPEKLSLNADQQAKYVELRAALRAAAPKQTWSAALPSVEEVRWLDQGLAADADEKTGFAPVQTPPVANTALDRFFTELSAVLDAKQRDQLVALRASASTHGEPAYVDMRAFFRAVHRLTLTDDQGEKIREIERIAMREHRRSTGDADARQTLARTARDQVRALLTADQIGELDRLMASGHGSRPGSPAASQGAREAKP
ncbi:MAG: hypothetical protein SF069_13715 [Phycisphaerae bacterium]|nr:hypothetical protein [Phycisphaerae bacterium]